MSIPEKYEEEILENIDEIIEEKEFPFSQLIGHLSSKAKIILFGDPGVGKSVALNKFVLESFQETFTSAICKDLPEKMEIPILIKANEFLKYDSCETLIKEYISPHTEIYDRIRTTTLLTDGLDEVPSAKRDELVKKAENFANKLNCPLIISTRKTDLIKNPPV